LFKTRPFNFKFYLKGLANLEVLVVTDNLITEVGPEAFPPKLRRLGIARNKLSALNGALR